MWFETLIIGFSGGFFAGFIAWYFRNYAFIKEFNGFYSRLTSLEGKVHGFKGNEKKARVRDEKQAAMIEGATLLKSGAKPAEVLQQLAVKYPEGIEALAKQFGLEL